MRIPHGSSALFFMSAGMRRKLLCHKISFGRIGQSLSRHKTILALCRHVAPVKMNPQIICILLSIPMRPSAILDFLSLNSSYIAKRGNYVGKGVHTIIVSRSFGRNCDLPFQGQNLHRAAGIQEGKRKHNRSNFAPSHAGGARKSGQPHMT